MKIFRLVSSVALLVLGSLELQAAELYWDPAGSTGTALGGPGNWDQTDAFWFNGTSDIPWVNANNDDANFTGTAGTVTLTESISAGNLYFTNAIGNYYITNATGAQILTVAGAIDTGGGEHTIAAPISSSALTKNGIGRLHLPVDNGATLNGTVTINQGDISVENNNAVGNSSSVAVTVAPGAALVLNGGAAGLSAFYPNVTINGTGTTNSGALRNLSGTTTFYGQIILGTNNSEIFSDSGTALVYDGEAGAITDNGNNYNLVIGGSGTGNVHLEGPVSIGGSMIIEAPAALYAYLIGITTAAWKSTYVAPGASFYVEANNSFGTSPATLMTTNTLLDGGTITAQDTFTMYPNSGITVTTNGGALICSSGTWTTSGIYSLSNTPVAFTANNGSTIAIAGASSTLNIGSGTLTLNSGNAKLQPTPQPVYSNLVINACTFTFNYDVGGGTPDDLGTMPNSFCPSNIWLNGGQFHVGHSTTIAAPRGMYVTSAGTTINEVTSGGTATMGSTISGPGTVTFASQNYILATNNTYGGTVINASTVVKVGNGGAFGTLGTGNTTDSGTLTFNRTGSYTYGGVISGSGVVNNAASGTITLTGKNTYSGATTLSAGTLFDNTVNGSGTGTSSVAVNSGATLGGSGAIAGAVTVAAGGTLALGLSTLTLTNNLSVAGNVTVSLNKSLTPSNGLAVVFGTLTRTGTGTLTVTNLGPALVTGDTFQLFSKAVSGGGTMAISGGGTGVVWNNNLAVNGTISVLSATLPTPVINQVQLNAGNIVFSGTNGPGGAAYYVFSSTNLLLPLSQWTSLSTNSFLSNGQFFITNPVVPGNPQQFYLLQAQ